MKSNKIAVYLVVMGVIVAGVMSGCSASATPEVQATETIAPVLADLQVVAEGKVVPVHSATLSFISGGVVDDIFIVEGSTVKKGDVIAQLSGTERLESQLSSAELAKISAQQAYDDLYKNVDVMKAQAELAVAQAKIALEDAKDERERKNYRRGSDTTLDGIRADAVLAKNALGYPEANDVEEADAKVALATANLAEAQRTLDGLKDGKPDPDDVALADAKLKEATASYDAAKAALDDIRLTAPFDGQLVANNLNVGEFIAPGAPAAVIGDVSEWEIETTDLTELDVVNIKEGMPVTIEFDALPDIQLKGVVSKVKMLGENKQGDITYTVKVSLEETDPRLSWNMTAFVTFPLE
jgi:multidrug efflux pump subunit AcrA (membrane-fusion protein)